MPTIYGIRKVVEHFKEKIFFFIDCHAHSNKRSTFIFGNCLEYYKCIDNYMFAKLMQLNCVNFDIDHCNFTESNMYSKDNRGDQREGCSRVAFYLNFELSKCYTLECSYICSSVVNPVPPSGLTESEVSNPESERYAEGPAAFDLDIFHDIGKAVCVSILDLTDKNAYSRVVNTEFGDIKGF